MRRLLCDKPVQDSPLRGDGRTCRRPATRYWRHKGSPGDGVKDLVKRCGPHSMTWDAHDLFDEVPFEEYCMMEVMES